MNRKFQTVRIGAEKGKIRRWESERMKLLVDETPKEPKYCIFSCKGSGENYVCKFQGSCIVCEDTKKCEFLKRIWDYQFD